MQVKSKFQEILETGSFNSIEKSILDCAFNTSKVPMLIGKHGEGKTSLIKILASKLNKTLSILNLSAIEPADFCGLPSTKNERTVYSMPSFLDSEIIFFDEIDSVRDSGIKATLKSIFIDRSINGVKLPDTTLLFCAGNGTQGNYDTVELDDALNSRIMKVNFEYSLADKLEYLSKYSKNPFYKFLQVKTEIFESLDSRTIEQALKVELKETLKLIVGNDIYRVFNQFVELSLVTLKDVMNDNYTYKELSQLTKVGLVIDVVSDFFELVNCDDKELSNLNKFINLLSAEDKANYFTRLKSICMKNPDKFKSVATNLDKKGLFKGQKEYLKELV